MNQNMYPNYYDTGTQPPYQNIPNAVPTPIPPNTPIEYAENLLQKNIGARARFYMSYSDSLEWRDRVFDGIIQDAGRDYTLLSNPDTGVWTILWNVYLNYVEFPEAIKH